VARAAPDDELGLELLTRRTLYQIGDDGLLVANRSAWPVI
jgi:hypothetical protein